MSRILYGAVTVGQRDGTGACSSVETRIVDGARWVLLVAVRGDLAAPALESIKSSFVKVIHVDMAAAAKLVASAPPPPYVAGVAIVLLAGPRAFAAASGTGACYVDRAGVSEAFDGACELGPGHTILAASHVILGAGEALVAPTLPPGPDDAFRNDGLDAALEAALGHGDRGLVAVAAARVAS